MIQKTEEEETEKITQEEKSSHGNECVSRAGEILCS